MKKSRIKKLKKLVLENQEYNKHLDNKTRELNKVLSELYEKVGCMNEHLKVKEEQESIKSEKDSLASQLIKLLEKNSLSELDIYKYNRFDANALITLFFINNKIE